MIYFQNFLRFYLSVLSTLPNFFTEINLLNNSNPSLYDWMTRCLCWAVFNFIIRWKLMTNVFLIKLLFSCYFILLARFILIGFLKSLIGYQNLMDFLELAQDFIFDNFIFVVCHFWIYYYCRPHQVINSLMIYYLTYFF